MGTPVQFCDSDLIAKLTDAAEKRQRGNAVWERDTAIELDCKDATGNAA
jgi:hypothetical protein